MNTIERVFGYKDVSDDKKVKLVALKLYKYASIWWRNVLSKRARKGKGKIRSWRKMKKKNLRPNFFHPTTSKITTLNSMTLGKNLRERRSIPMSLKSLS